MERELADFVGGLASMSRFPHRAVAPRLLVPFPICSTTPYIPSQFRICLQDYAQQRIMVLFTLLFTEVLSST